MQTIDRSKTQVKSTAGTYRKVRDFIQNEIKDFPESLGRGLDFGAGLCEGTDILNDIPNIMFNSFEPFAKDGVNPDFRTLDEIFGKFDYIVSNCVLNVIEDIEERKQMVKEMLSRLSMDGKAIIMVRNWNAVKGNKTNAPHADGFVNSKGTFQRGFTTKELMDLVIEVTASFGDRGGFKIAPSRLGDVGVEITRLS
jgi:hypothetical protein